MLRTIYAHRHFPNQTILGSQFLLPESPAKPIYYIALITELCKLSPQTVGPAVGKSIRKLYGYCANGLDVEILRRFSEWFSVHMSNFGFQWVWKEWSVISIQSINRVLKTL
jgi:nuclear cap-binding protein subunit 1